MSRRTVVTFVRTNGVFDLHGGEKFSGRLLYDDIAGVAYATDFEYDSGRSAYTAQVATESVTNDVTEPEPR